MSDNTYQQARLFIGDKEYTQFNSVNIKFPGNSKIISLNCVLNDTDAQEGKFLNKELKFYLNYGSEDNVPIFRGFIRQFNPSDKSIKISAFDGRTYIQGKEAQTISLTEKDNFDGHTVSQYLSSIIQDKVNIGGVTRIGLNMLNETTPPALMKGVRGVNQSPYDLATKQLKSHLDTDSINDGVVFRYNIDMIDDGEVSNIVFVKDKSLDSEPSARFAYLDGIGSYTHKVRAVPSFVTTSTIDGKGAFYRDGNLPTGVIGSTLKGKFKDTASATEAAFFEVISKQKNTSQISLTATKAFYIGIGSIVELMVPEDELALNNHRVVSKTITYSSKGTICKLSLNKEPTQISDYVIKS